MDPISRASSSTSYSTGAQTYEMPDAPCRREFLHEAAARFPGLLQCKGFLREFVTPIVKASVCVQRTACFGGT